MLSSATFEPSTALANAIFCTNIGTVPPRLSTPRPPRPTRRSSRRVVFIANSVAGGPRSVASKEPFFTGHWPQTTGHCLSAQLILRRCHQDVQHVAHLAVHAFLGQNKRLGLIVSIAV